jgi:uncharacterized Zn finger protein (UPF0148 family)
MNTECLDMPDVLALAVCPRCGVERPDGAALCAVCQRAKDDETVRRYVRTFGGDPRNEPPDDAELRRLDRRTYWRIE